MGKHESSTPVERKIIREYFQKHQNIAKVTELLNFSRGRVKNAIQYYIKNGNFENLPRNKPRKTTPADDRQLVRMSKCDSFLTSTEIRQQMDEYHGVKISAQTVLRR